jgi:hypothetical protein
MAPILINPDGSFRVTGLRPGKVRIVLGGTPAPKGFALLRVEREGSVQRDGVEVGAHRRCVDAAQHVQVIVKLQPRVQPADDVDFGRAGVGGFFRGGDHLLEWHLVRAVLAALAVERAELAAQRADVRVVDVTIAIVVGSIAVQCLAHEICKPADAVNIAAAVQRDAVVMRERHAREHPVAHALKRRIGYARHGLVHHDRASIGTRCKRGYEFRAI